MTRTLPLLLLTLLLGAGLALGPMRESDLFFRIKAGEEILKRGELPEHNLFSFTHPDHPDLDASWLFEVGAAALYRAGGFPGIVLAKSAVMVAALAVLFWVCRRRGAGSLASSLAVSAAALVMRERMVERPHVFSFLFEALLLALACGWLAKSGGARGSPSQTSDCPSVAGSRAGSRVARRDLRRGLALLAIVVLWANFHAGVFLAPWLIGWFGIGALLDRSRSTACRALLLAMVAGAAAFVSPLGTDIVRYFTVHFAITRVHAVDEFRRATLISDWPFFIYVAVIALSLAAEWRWSRDDRGVLSHQSRSSRAEFPVLLPIVATGVLAFWTVRFVADFALLAAPLLATRLTNLGRALVLRFGWRRPPLWLALGLAAAPLIVPLRERAAEAHQGRPWFDVGLDEAPIPMDAIRFAEEHGLRERMYNDFEIGSYLALEGYPRFRVFVDPRLPAYPLELHRELGRFDHDHASWQSVMDRYAVESALLAYAGLNRRVAWWDPEKWALIYRRNDARLFVRRLPRWRALIAAQEVPATFAFTVEEGAQTIPLLQPPQGSPVRRCEWNRRLGDLYFELGDKARALAAYEAALEPPGCLESDADASLRGWLGATALERGDAARAVELLRGAVELLPQDLASRTNLALALEKHGDGAAASAEWQRIAEAAQGTELGEKARARARRAER